jgi:hypothetical protein
MYIFTVAIELEVDRHLHYDSQHCAILSFLFDVMSRHIEWALNYIVLCSPVSTLYSASQTVHMIQPAACAPMTPFPATGLVFCAFGRQVDIGSGWG